MSDMSSTIVAKSDQLNADDLLGGPRTITITRVTVREGGEQPVSVHYEGDDGKPWKPCKSMCRVLVNVWGVRPDGYVGKSLTLYRDPSVKWAGMEVGGIRISHMSNMDEPKAIPLTVTKGSKKMTRVEPLTVRRSPPPPPPPPPADNSGPADFGDDEPSGFPFTLCDSQGREHVFRGDGAKWRDTLVNWMSKAFDAARRAWDANEEYIKAAEDAGQEAFARPVREKWQQRKADAQGAGG